MRILNVVLLTAFQLGLIACAQGETIDSGNDAGVSGTGGAAAGTGGGPVAGTGGGSVVGGSGGGSSVCELQTQDDACNNCINTTCLAICNDCANDQACLDLLSCMQNCSDATCDNACIGQYPTGEAPLMAFIGENGCMTTSCANDCGSDSCGMTSSDTVCDDCMNQRCFTECAACANNQSCLDLLTCIQGCTTGDTVCEDNCTNQYPSGLDDLLNFIGSGGCLDVNCTTECG